MQEYIRYVGKVRDSASSILLKGSSSATLQQGSCRKLSPSELMDMIERIGHHIDLENLERIGLFYDIKKNSFSLSLYWNMPGDRGPLLAQGFQSIFP